VAHPLSLSAAIKLNAAIAAYQQGDLAAASHSASEVLAEMESCAEAWRLLAAIALDIGDLDNADTFIGHAVHHAPDNHDAHKQMAQVCLLKGDGQAAIDCAERAVNLVPSDLDARLVLGEVLTLAERPREALPQLRAAIQLDPRSPQAILALANCLIDLSEPEEAIDLLNGLLALSNTTEHRKALAHALVMAKRPAEADALYQGIRQTDHSPNTAIDHAIAQRYLRHYGEAISTLVGLGIDTLPDPEASRALSVLGAVCNDTGEVIVASNSFETAVARNPHNIEARLNLSSIRLLLNDKTGWDNWGWRTGGHHMRRDEAVGMRSWQGEAIPGRLHIPFEQGIGDQILFANLLPLIQGRASEIIAYCDRRLVPIFARSIPGITFTPKPDDGLKGDPEDRYCLIGDIPELLGLDPQPNLAAHTLISAEAAAVNDARQRLAALAGGRPTIGIAWHSGNIHFGAFRSVDPIALADAIPEEYALVSLQYGDVSATAQRLRTERGRDLIVDPTVDQIQQFDGFLAQISALDAIATIDNSTAHAAGGLGLPAHVLLPRGGGLVWYWGLQQTIDPWYSHLRLLRQSTPGDWSAPFSALHDSLSSARS
jgi:tetratricopeptide (TPR) repeat protein